MSINVRVTRALVAAVVIVAAVVGAGGRAASAVPSFVLYGRGWGHGVGMSQWGAKGLADKQWSFSRILSLFYRGTALQQSTSVKGLRVGLLQEQNNIDLTGNGRFEIYDHNGRLRVAGVNGQTWHVRPAGGQLTVSNPQGVVVFNSAPPVTVRYENFATLLRLPQTGRDYKHGRIDLDINGSTGKARAILLIPIEQYLYGLGEMPASWGNEALKAQVVAARTYAVEKVLRLGQNRSVCNCGVYASTADQVYVGASQEVPRWVSAVDNTPNQILTYQGTAIQAYYSSSDGGMTENNEYVFGGNALPYLRASCDPGDYAAGSNPNANWAVTMDGNQLGQRLAAGGYAVGTVQRIDVLPPLGVSGRVRGVIDSTHGGFRIVGSSSTARLSGDRFRSLVGLKSTMNVHRISGNIRLRYDSLNCAPGRPTTETYNWRDGAAKLRGLAQNFTTGRLFLNTSTAKVFWISGPILTRYDSLRSKGTDFGLPTSDVFSISGGRRANFEHGYITWTASNGQTVDHPTG
jgi:stage II sporulation protein D